MVELVRGLGYGGRWSVVGEVDFRVFCVGWDFFVVVCCCLFVGWVREGSVFSGEGFIILRVVLDLLR